MEAPPVGLLEEEEEDDDADLAPVDEFEPAPPEGVVLLLLTNKLVTMPQMIVNGRSRIETKSLAYETSDDDEPPDEVDDDDDDGDDDDEPADEDVVGVDDDDDDDDGSNWLNFLAALLPAERIFF